jgi:hypothetical protein
MSTRESDQHDSLIRLASAVYAYDDKDAEQMALMLTIRGGHLAVEEQLTAIRKKSVPYPKALDGKRLPFSTRLCLSKAMKYRPEDHWIWNAIEKLDTVRNDLAHTLKSPKFETKLEAFLTYLTYILTNAAGSLSRPHDEHKVGQVRSTLFFLTGALDGIENDRR